MLRLIFLPTLTTAFNFGGFLQTALPSIKLPEIPSEFSNFITELPSILIPSLFPFPSIPEFNFTSLIPIPSIPEFPSLPPLESLFDEIKLPIISIPPLPTDFEDIRKSLGISPFPTQIASSEKTAGFHFFTIPTPPLFNPDDIRDAISRIGRDNRTLKVPESEAELRDLIGRQTRFNLSQADDFVDRLGAATGYDVHASIRMISGLVLTNESLVSVYERSTAAFRLATTRLDEGAPSYTLSGLQIILPLLGLPANQTLSVVQWAQNPYEALSSQPLNSSVISIMIADAATGNETRIADLQELLNFTIPVEGLGYASCVFWNGTEWSDEGCRALAATDFEVTCGCTHLTDFAIILMPIVNIVAVPSPSVQPIYESLLPSTVPHLLISVPSAAASKSTNEPLIIGLSLGGCLLVGGAIGLVILNVRHKRNKGKVLALPRERWAFPVKDLESANRASTTKNVLAQVTVRK